jgi:copper homeostasis protein
VACKIEDTCKLEVCCFDLDSVRLAEDLGVPCIEFCTDYGEDGLWPGEDLIREARSLYSGCLHVMVRPRPGDFLYDDDDWEEMARQINVALDLDVDGLTFGAVGAEGRFPIRDLIDLCEMVPEDKILTFHRAFDQLEDPGKALGPMGRMGFRRVLSSGGGARAAEQGQQLKLYRQWAGSRLEVVAAGGVRPADVPLLRSFGIRSFHSSASMTTDGRADQEILRDWIECLGLHSPSKEA